MTAQGVLNNQNIVFQIVTGDGETYTPQKEPAGAASLNPNTSGYEKPDVQGSEVRRNSGANPVIDLIFSLPTETVNNFLNSVKNPNVWTVTHPVYNTFKCYPTSVNLNEESLSQVRFTVKVWQTSDIQSILTVDSQSDVANKAETLQADAVAIVEELDAGDVSAINSLIEELDEVYEGVETSETRAIIDDATDAMLTATDNTTDAMLAVQRVLLIPRDLKIDMRTKVRLFENQFNQAKNITINSYNLCRFQEFLINTQNSGISDTIMNPVVEEDETDGLIVDDIITDSVDLDPDYNNRDDLLDIALSVEELYQDGVTEIDRITALELKDDTGANYISDPDLYQLSDQIVSLSITGLNQVAFDARVATSYITEKETTVEILSHELYGMASDKNIDELINVNDLFGFNTLLNTWRNYTIEKGINITYYV